MMKSIVNSAPRGLGTIENMLVAAESNYHTFINTTEAHCATKELHFDLPDWAPVTLFPKYHLYLHAP